MKKKAQLKNIKTAVLTLLVIVIVLLVFVGPIGNLFAKIFNFLGLEETCDETGKTIEEYTSEIKELLEENKKQETIDKYNEFKLCFPDKEYQDPEKIIKIYKEQIRSFLAQHSTLDKALNLYDRFKSLFPTQEIEKIDNTINKYRSLVNTPNGQCYYANTIDNKYKANEFCTCTRYAKGQKLNFCYTEPDEKKCFGQGYCKYCENEVACNMAYEEFKRNCEWESNKCQPKGGWVEPTPEEISDSLDVFYGYASLPKGTSTAGTIDFAQKYLQLEYIKGKCLPADIIPPLHSSLSIQEVKSVYAEFPSGCYPHYPNAKLENSPITKYQVAIYDNSFFIRFGNPDNTYSGWIDISVFMNLNENRKILRMSTPFYYLD